VTFKKHSPSPPTNSPLSSPTNSPNTCSKRTHPGSKSKLSESQDMAINYLVDQFTEASTPIDDEGINIFFSECEQDDQLEKNKKQKFDDDDDMFTW